MKYFLLIFALMLMSNTFGQKFLNSFQKEHFAIYQDSLNNYFNGKTVLPQFIGDSALDSKSRWFWLGFHSTRSLRWALISEIDSADKLEKLKQALYNRRNSIDPWQPEGFQMSIPFHVFSTFDLIEFRLSQIYQDIK